MKKIIITICSSVFLIGASVAQQLPLISHYYINPMIYNPAMSGIGSTGNFYLIHRSQWTGVANAPQINTLTFDMPVKFNKLGIGLTLRSNTVGIARNTSGNLAFSYRIAEDLHLGAAIGIVNNKVTFSDSKVATQGDQVLLNTTDDNRTALDGNIGFVYTPGHLEVGFSIPQVFGNKIEIANTGDKSSSLGLTRQYIGTVKYTFDINKERGITLYPIVMIRAAGSNIPNQYEGDLVANWTKVGWAAVGLRKDDAYYLNIGLRFKDLSVGYVYEMPAGDNVRKLLGNTSEILVSYSFDARPKKDISAAQDSIARVLNELVSNSKRDSSTIANINSKLNKVQENSLRIDTLNKRIDKANFDFSKSKDAASNTNNIGDLYNLKKIGFAFNSSNFDNKSLESLKELAHFMKQNESMRIAIYGHADEVGSDESNFLLSERRAQNVYDFLANKAISKERMSFEGFGESKPLVKGDSAQARAKNRRIEFEILSK